MSTTTVVPRGSEIIRPERRLPAIVAAVLLLVAATILINWVLPPWGYPVCGIVTAGFLVALSYWSGLEPSRIGLDRRYVGRAAVIGLLGLGLVALAFGAALAIPALRLIFLHGGMDARPVGNLLWEVLVRIPLGTVLLEEVAFRGVLPALFGGGRQWRWKAVLGAAALFGLWHVHPALALEHNAMVREHLGALPLVVVPVLVMLAAAVAGVVLYWWRHAGRGLLSPALVHLATNSGVLFSAWFLLAYN
ncbi:MAG: CPBP family intramembrane glutamic endopeptidase [Pseudonocardiaceae bacterium]